MKPDKGPSLGRILESAVILGWSDLMKDAKSGVLHLDHFEDGFRSESLTDNLEFIMPHQHAFSWSPDFERTGLLQIKLPTEQEIAAAADSLRDAYCHINSFSAELPRA